MRLHVRVTVVGLHVGAIGIGTYFLLGGGGGGGHIILEGTLSSTYPIGIVNFGHSHFAILCRLEHKRSTYRG